MKVQNITLSIANLSFSYTDKEKTVIRDVDIQIPRGSVTSLLGLNGSGKTTLLLLILGFLKPLEGEIRFDFNGESYPIERLNGSVGYLPQLENIPFDYPVKEFILLGRSPRIKFFNLPGESDYKKVADIHNFLNLKEIENKKLHEISGGELQRVRIARTLAQDPKIILMDEPMTHLDIKHKKYISGLLNALAQQGRIVIYSTHDPLDAIKNSDYCILLGKSMQAFSGKIKELTNSNLLSKYFEMKLEIDNDGNLVINE